MPRSFQRLDQIALHEQLVRHAAEMQQPDRHLSHLLNDGARLKAYSRSEVGLFYDFSRQRLDYKTMDLLLAAAAELNLRQRFEKMCAGEKINVTERRAVLHTAGGRPRRSEFKNLGADRTCRFHGTMST